MSELENIENYEEVEEVTTDTQNDLQENVEQSIVIPCQKNV